MENYEITKEQILELDKFAVQGCDNIIRDRLKLFFPEAFKKELEVGKWYRNLNGALANYQGGTMGYGFAIGSVWMLFTDNWSFDTPENWVEATPQEVETALIAEANKRYKFGDKLTKVREDMSNGKRLFNPKKIWIDCNKLYFKDTDDYNSCIFNDKGKWSEIIPKETKVISIEKAVKILSKKYGQKVEIK